MSSNWPYDRNFACPAYNAPIESRFMAMFNEEMANSGQIRNLNGTINPPPVPKTVTITFATNTGANVGGGMNGNLYPSFPLNAGYGLPPLYNMHGDHVNTAAALGAPTTTTNSIGGRPIVTPTINESIDARTGTINFCGNNPNNVTFKPIQMQFDGFIDHAVIAVGKSYPNMAPGHQRHQQQRHHQPMYQHSHYNQHQQQQQHQQHHQQHHQQYPQQHYQHHQQQLQQQHQQHQQQHPHQQQHHQQQFHHHRHHHQFAENGYLGRGRGMDISSSIPAPMPEHSFNSFNSFLNEGSFMVPPTNVSPMAMPPLFGPTVPPAMHRTLPNLPPSPNSLLQPPFMDPAMAELAASQYSFYPLNHFNESFSLFPDNHMNNGWIDNDNCELGRAILEGAMRAMASVEHEEDESNTEILPNTRPPTQAWPAWPIWCSTNANIDAAAQQEDIPLVIEEDREVRYFLPSNLFDDL